MAELKFLCNFICSLLQVFGKGDIYAPSDYLVLMRTARSKQPYTVHSVSHTFFKDYDSLPGNFASIRPGKKAGDPTVSDVRGLLYLPSGIVCYKLRHTQEWVELPCRRRVQHSSPGQLYKAPLKINADKFKNLQELKSVMPADCHDFYDGLLHE